MLRIVPLVLSSLLIAAHFFRSGHYVLVALALVAPLVLMLLRRWWIVLAVQVLLVAAAMEWIRTAIEIGAARAAAGAPSTRMFVILGAVALFTVLSAIPLSRTAIRS